MKKNFMAVGLAFFLSTSCLAASFNGANGSLPGNTPVTKTAFLMAHNANTTGWLYNQQTKGVTELLEKYGVRGLKIHLHWYTEPKKSLLGKLKQVVTGKASLGGEPYIALCHEFKGGNNCKDTLIQRSGRSPRPAVEIFAELADYLASHSSEVIILRLDSNLYGSSRTSENGTKSYTDEQTTTLFNNDLESSGLAKYAYKLGVWPTLGSMRSSGKRLLIFTDEDKTAASKYVNRQRGNVQQTHWEDNKRDGCKLAVKGNGMFEVTINYKLSIDKKSLLGFGAKFYNLFKSDEKKLPTYDYSKVNDSEAALLRIKECEKVHGMTPNIIASDHVDQGNLVDLVDAMNEDLLQKK